MGFAEDKFYDYLRRNLILLEPIRVDELLIPLSGCLSKASAEKLHTYVRNQGNRNTVMDFYLALSRSDNWVTHFIAALRHCEHTELADTFDRVYSSFQPNRRESSSPQSLPPSVNNNNRQPQEDPQRRSSLPGPVPTPSPESSQRLKKIQPEQEMIRGSPSHQNHEFRSLPSFPQEPPAQSRAPLSHNVSAPKQSGTRTLEDDSVRIPVPETNPYQATPPEGDVEDESSDSGNAQIGHDPLPKDSSSPSLKETQPNVSIRPSSEDVSLAKVPETHSPPSYSPSTRGEQEAVNWRSRPEHDKETYNSEQPVLASSTPSVRSKVKAGVQHNGKAAYEPVNNAPDRNPASYRPVNREAQEKPKRQRPPNQWVDNVPDRRPAGHHPENREAAQLEPKRERPPNEQVDIAPDRSTASHRPVNRGSDQVEPNRESLPNEQVSSESSCRPYSSDEYFSKPGVLSSTPDCADVTGGESPLLSQEPNFQISYETERSESGDASGRSSTSVAQDRTPPVSTPKTKSIQIKDRRSPEENDFMFDSRSSPGRHRGLDNSPPPKQPEENSYESKGVSRHTIHYEERPGEDLMEGNDNALRNRLTKTSNTSEPDDQKDTKKTEGINQERTILITVAVASLCLSLYLLWKSRNN